jgi:putrescine transport system ATP-binding protein
VRLACGSAGTTVEADQAAGAANDATAWFAIRPEKIAISREAPADPSVNALFGEVWDIGYLGDISVFHVRLPSGENVKATVTNRTRLVERPITWEDKVWLTWPRDAGVILTR